MLQLTRKTDYGIRLMLEVGTHGNGGMSTAEVARRQEIPYQFLRKVARTLANSGLLVSERGGKGGLTLARAPEDISVLDILRALGLPPINDCSVDPDNCPRREICAVFPVWFEAQREIERVLGAARLSKLVRAHRALLVRAAAAETGQPALERGYKYPIPIRQMAHARGSGNRLESVADRPHLRRRKP